MSAPLPPPLIYRGHVVVPNDPRLDVLMPHAKKMMHDGQMITVVPHKLDETRVLKNLGYDVRPPIMTSYNWPGPSPFDSQRITAALITMNPRSFVLNGIGTGKTRAALFAFDFLKQQGTVRRMIVTCPLSTVRQTWAKEIFAYFPHLTYRVLTGSRARRLKLLAEAADIYIVNHDGLEVVHEALLQRTDIGMAVLDELSVYKDATSDRWKFANALFNRDGGPYRYVTGMTGTPVPLAPTDCYGQVRLVAPRQMPMAFSRFREKVQFKVTNFKWVSRPEALTTVFATMQPAVRFTRDECYDLPPCQTISRTATLTNEQAKLYKEIAQEFAVTVAQGDIKAFNEADRLNKLTQIALGAVYTMEKDVVELPCGPRLSVLDELIAESASKTIVFTPYKHSLRLITEHVKKRGYTVGVISGDVSHNAREAVFHNFMNNPDPQVLIAHPQTMSHGLTLTAASTIVWYGPPTSLETYEQANGRITRAGQQHNQFIAHIAATRLEERIYDRLVKRAEIQGLLLEMFEAQELEDLL